MNITSILKGIENLALELFIWIIFIPKTIYQIIKDPKAIPDYITTELAKEKRFENYMSPVLLYLTVSVILYASLRYVSFINNNSNFTENVKGPEGLLFLFIPLSFVLVTAIFIKDGFRKEVLTRNLYIQCYYFSILMLSLMCWRIVESTTFFTGYHLGDYPSFGALIAAKTKFNVGNIPFLLLAATIIWLLYLEFWLLRKELKIGKLKALGIMVFYLAILIFSSVGYDFLRDTVINENGTAESESAYFYVKEDGSYYIRVNSINTNFYGSLPSGYWLDAYENEGFRIVLKNNSGDPISKENWSYFKNKKESLDGLHINWNMTLIDSIKPKTRVNFTAIEGDSLSFTFRLLDSIKGRNINDIAFDIIDSSNNSIIYDSIGVRNTHWDLKIRDYNKTEGKLFDELVFSGLIKETNNYDLLIKSNYVGLYDLRLNRTRSAILIDDPYAEEPFTDMTNETYSSVYSDQEIEFNQIYQGVFQQSYFYFKAKKGDAIKVFISPLPWDTNTDISFDIFQQGKSVNQATIWGFTDYFYIIYILFFAPIIFLLFRGLIKKSKQP